MTTSKEEKLETLLSAVNALLHSMEIAPSSNSMDAWRFSGFKIYIRKYNQLVNEISKVEQIDIPLDIYDEEKIPSAMNTIGIQQSNYFQSTYANLSILRSWLEQKVGRSAKEASSLEMFLQTRLRSAIFEEPKKEIDVQNAVEQLLIGRGLQKGTDYDRETGRVKISVTESIPDFIFRPLSLALEIKFVKDKSAHKRIVNEISADIVAYATGYQSLIFLIYDIGTIKDEIQFKVGLETPGNVSVLVVKH